MSCRDKAVIPQHICWGRVATWKSAVPKKTTKTGRCMPGSRTRCAEGVGACTCEQPRHQPSQCPTSPPRKQAADRSARMQAVTACETDTVGQTCRNRYCGTDMSQAAELYCVAATEVSNRPVRASAGSRPSWPTRSAPPANHAIGRRQSHRQAPRRLRPCSERVPPLQRAQGGPRLRCRPQRPPGLQGCLQPCWRPCLPFVLLPPGCHSPAARRL